MNTRKKNILMAGMISLAILILGASGFAYLDQQPAQSVEKEPQAATTQVAEPEPATVAGEVEQNLVCMVNNRFMGKDQIPVLVGEKTYYGCCQMCVGRLQNDEAARMAQDPLTGEAVDKSEAFIAIKPQTEDEVLYFKSRENLSRYQQESGRLN